MVSQTSITERTFQDLNVHSLAATGQAADFFSSYVDDGGEVFYPLEGGFGNMGLSDVDRFCLAGRYFWNRPDEADGYDQYIVVSDALWDRLYQSASEEIRDDRISPQEYWMTREALVENYDRSLSGSLTFYSNTYQQDSTMAFDNVRQFSHFFFWLSFAVFVVFLAVESLYGMNVFRSLRQDYAVLHLLGKRKRDFFLISLLSFVPSMALALVLSLALSQVLTSAIFASVIHATGFVGVLCAPFGYAYLGLFATAVVLLLVDSLFSLFSSRRKVVSVLKEQD